MVMPESKAYYCERCGYKGHVKDNCCNPYPDQKCLFCQRPGHVFQDCVRRDEPRIREMLSSLPPRQSDPLVKKDEPNHNMSNTISTFKRRREALDQSQQATNSFITNLVNATTHKETQDIVPVRPHELVHIMDGVLSWEPGDDCNLWGKDLTETVKAMKMYHLSEGVNFFRIFFAVHRLEAGFTIHCAHPGCKGNALIITPEFQNVNVSTRSGYPRDQPEHAVFLASSCSHSDFSFEWRRSRVEEGDLTPLYLLQAAHANPIFHQFTELKAGITTRDLDLEYDAMLELEKQRQALDAEQQKVAEASTKLRLQEAVFKRHAELLGSPMDWKAPTPVTNKFLTSSSPLTPRKRQWGDSSMADVSSPRHDCRFESGGQSSPKRPRFEDPRPPHQYAGSTPQSFSQPADQSSGTVSEYPTTTPRSFDNAHQYAASEADRDVNGTDTYSRPRGDRGGGGQQRGGRNDRGGRTDRGGRNDRGGGRRGGQSSYQGGQNYPRGEQRHQQGGQSFQQTEQSYQKTDQHYQQGGQDTQDQQHGKDNHGQRTEKKENKKKNQKKKGEKEDNKKNDKKDKHKKDNKSKAKQAEQGEQDSRQGDGRGDGHGDFWENYARNSAGDSNGGPSGPSGPSAQRPTDEDEDGYIE